MRMRRMVSSLVCVSLLMVVAGAAEADSIRRIGLNFVGGRSGGGGGGGGGAAGNSLLPGDPAGVVPQINWNNAFGSNNAVPQALVDDLNAPTGATATWGGVPNSWTVSGAAAADGDAKLMNGYLDTNTTSTTTVQITGIPYSQYDVAVYYDGSGTGRSGNYTVNGILQGPLQDVANWPVGGPAPTNGAYDFATGDGVGNYATWTGLSGPLTVTATTQNLDFRAPLNGIQIVDARPAGDIPEPVTMLSVFASVGALAGYARRRRHA